MTGSRARTRRALPWRPLAAGLGLLLALQPVLFGLLVLGQAVPDRPVAQHLVASVDAGTYGPSSLPDRMGGTSDSFTECVVATTGIGAPPEESAWSRAGRMPRAGGCDRGIDTLRALAAGERVDTQDNYFRYWSGFTVFTKPVLALVGLEGLRIVAGTMMLVGLVGAFLAVRARTSTAVSVALLLPFVLGTNMLSTPSTSFSQSISIAFIFLSVWLTALGASRSVRLGCLGAGLGAALFCFVDLLTTPAVPWAMSAFVLGAAVWCRGRDIGRALTATLAAGAVWAVSFAVTWISRWVIAALALGIDEALASVRGKVEERTGGDWNGVSDTFGAGVISNVDYWWGTVPTAGAVLLGCTAAALAGLVLAVVRGGVRRLGAAAVLAAPALVVPVWYTVLSNHSQIHEFFVHRNVPAALAVATAAALAVAVRPLRTEEPREVIGTSGADAPAESSVPVR